MEKALSPSLMFANYRVLKIHEKAETPTTTVLLSKRFTHYSPMAPHRTSTQKSAINLPTIGNGAYPPLKNCNDNNFLRYPFHIKHTESQLAHTKYCSACHQTSAAAIEVLLPWSPEHLPSYGHECRHVSGHRLETRNDPQLTS